MKWTDYKHSWIEALRSEKYEQGRNRLKDDSNKFCCLGVLCEVVGSDISRAYQQRMSDVPINNSNNPFDNVFMSMGLQRTLVDMNDSDLKSFEEIADYLEAIND